MKGFDYFSKDAQKHIVGMTIGYSSGLSLYCFILAESITTIQCDYGMYLLNTKSFNTMQDFRAEIKGRAPDNSTPDKSVSAAVIEVLGLK